MDYPQPSKPPLLFGRDLEWSDLASFAANPAEGATMATLYGYCCSAGRSSSVT